jgi:hypothetical protein
MWDSRAPLTQGARPGHWASPVDYLLEVRPAVQPLRPSKRLADSPMASGICTAARSAHIRRTYAPPQGLGHGDAAQRLAMRPSGFRLFGIDRVEEAMYVCTG